jgi:hypothetical protein
VLRRSTAAKDISGVMCCSLGRFLQLSLSHLFLGMPAALIFGAMRLLSSINLQLQHVGTNAVVVVVGFLALMLASSGRFPLSSSLLTEFLGGQKCSNCGLGCFPFCGALFEDIHQFV